MLKKNVKYYSIFFLFAILVFSCKQTGQAEPAKLFKNKSIAYIVVDGLNINYTFINDKYYNNISKKVVIKKTIFKNCSFTQESIAVDTLACVIFENCNFTTYDNVDLRVLSIDDVDFNDCSFNSFSIKNSIINKNLKFINCKVNEILFDQTQFNGVSIVAFKDTINKIRIQSSPSSINLELTGNINNIYLEGGEIKYLDVANITNPNSKLSVFSTYLINPNFVNKSAKNYTILFNSSIENATMTPDNNSILKEELEWKDKNTSNANETERNEIKKGYLVSKSVYSHLSKIFENEKKYDLADYFYFRSKICENEINSKGIYKSINTIFNEKIRGNYGTNYFVIIESFFLFTFLFSIIYFILGYFKLAFGYYINTNLLGEKLENQKPIIITYHRNKFGLLVFIANCLIFSLNNMVLGGLSKGFHFYNFTTLYLFPPRKYGTIGIGLFFSIIQSIIGLILVFFFITSFLRLNR